MKAEEIRQLQKYIKEDAKGALKIADRQDLPLKVWKALFQSCRRTSFIARALENPSLSDTQIAACLDAAGVWEFLSVGPEKLLLLLATSPRVGVAEAFIKSGVLTGRSSRNMKRKISEHPQTNILLLEYLASLPDWWDECAIYILRNPRCPEYLRVAHALSGSLL